MTRKEIVELSVPGTEALERDPGRIIEARLPRGTAGTGCRRSQVVHGSWAPGAWTFLKQPC